MSNKSLGKSFSGLPQSATGHRAAETVDEILHAFNSLRAHFKGPSTDGVLREGADSDEDILELTTELVVPEPNARDERKSHRNKLGKGPFGLYEKRVHKRRPITAKSTNVTSLADRALAAVGGKNRGGRELVASETVSERSAVGSLAHAAAPALRKGNGAPAKESLDDGLNERHGIVGRLDAIESRLNNLSTRMSSLEKLFERLLEKAD